MSKAFTCDVCGATFDSEPANKGNYHLEFAALYPKDDKRSDHKISAELAVEIKFPYGGDICSLCKRKAMKMVALWLTTQGGAISPATRRIEAYKVATRNVAYFRWWKQGRKGQSKIRNLE